MSVCGWTDGDIFLTETSDGEFTMHVREGTGRPQDGQSFILDTQATLAKMHELDALGYSIPPHAIALLAEDVGAAYAVQDGDWISLAVKVEDAVWLAEALSDIFVECEKELSLIDADDADADSSTEFYATYRDKVREFHSALEPFVHEAAWGDFRQCLNSF